MDDNKPVVHLTPEQETIQVLCAIIGAVHFETSDPVTKQFVTMMISKAAEEYDKATHDPLAPALFTSQVLIANFREAMALMRTGYEEVQRQSFEHNRAISPIILPRNGNSKHK